MLTPHARSIAAKVQYLHRKVLNLPSFRFMFEIQTISRRAEFIFTKETAAVPNCDDEYPEW